MAGQEAHGAMLVTTVRGARGEMVGNVMQVEENDGPWGGCTWGGGTVITQQ